MFDDLANKQLIDKITGNSISGAVGNPNLFANYSFFRTSNYRKNLLLPERIEEWEQILSVLTHEQQEWVERNNIGPTSVVYTEYYKQGVWLKWNASYKSVILSSMMIDTFTAPTIFEDPITEIKCASEVDDE